MTPDLWTTTSSPLKHSAPHLIFPLYTGIVLRKGNRKHNLGTSSIFHEFSFRPEPPLALVDRSSCCHIFTTWGYSCYLEGLPLTQAVAQAATKCGRTPTLLLLQTQGELVFKLKSYLHQLRLCSLGGLIGKLHINFFSAGCFAGDPAILFSKYVKIAFT